MRHARRGLQKCRRRVADEMLEVVDEVRLIVIAVVERHAQRIAAGRQQQFANGQVETRRTLKALGRDADLAAKDAFEMTPAHAELIGQAVDFDHAVTVVELAQCRLDRRLFLVVTRQTAQQPGFEQTDALRAGARLRHALGDFAALAPHTSPTDSTSSRKSPSGDAQKWRNAPERKRTAMKPSADCGSG